MKKIILIFLLAVSTVGFAQAQLDKFEGRDDVTSIVITAKMLEMMSQAGAQTFDADMQEYSTMLRKIDYMKLYSTASEKVTSEMGKAFGKYIKKGKLQELVKMGENKQLTKIAVKMASDGEKINELVFFSEGDSDWNPTILMLLKGNFTLEDISALSDKFPIPGFDGLKDGRDQKL